MAKHIWNGFGSLYGKISPNPSFITGANLKKKPVEEKKPAEEEKPSVGWNNRVCKNCGRPYTQPPPSYSFLNVEEHPLWPGFQLTLYCNKGLCNGVQPSGECKPHIVKTE
jgi:hypothetical protein